MLPDEIDQTTRSDKLLPSDETRAVDVPMRPKRRHGSGERCLVDCEVRRQQLLHSHHRELARLLHVCNLKPAHRVGLDAGHAADAPEGRSTYRAAKVEHADEALRTRLVQEMVACARSCHLEDDAVVSHHLTEADGTLRQPLIRQELQRLAVQLRGHRPWRVHKRHVHLLLLLPLGEREVGKLDAWSGVTFQSGHRSRSARSWALRKRVVEAKLRVRNVGAAGKQPAALEARGVVQDTKEQRQG
mmetsp:Transcript_5122/g.11725  ORF Transcript_5122/g.11725 Transcript_5122/m.11725 type:complete len:244 (-) Transcript_5122:764-1495(-)